MSEITEYKVIDIWHDLELVYPKKNDKSEVINNFLGVVFADSGLKLEFSSPKFKVVKQRCLRILDKIKDNKAHHKPKYHGFPDPEKIFFSESEFPELCTKDVPKK